MTQLEWLEKAVTLKKEYPEMDIVVLADSNELLDDCNWTLHQISFVDITYFYSKKELILIGDEIMDYFIEDFELSEEQAEEKFNKEVKRVIAIKTEAMNI